MNFDFTEEQGMLRDSVARFVQDSYSFDTRRQIAASERGISPEVWQTFAELGWLSVPFAEEHGGFGGGPVDTLVIMEELGKGLVLEPYLATALLFGGLLERGGTETQRSEWLPKIIEGGCQGAFAFLERQSRFEITDVATRAEADGEGFRLSGEKVVVLNGSNADQLIVTARTAGGQFEREGISLFLVPADAAGLERLDYPMMDGQRVANIVLKDVRVPADALVGQRDRAMAVVDPVVDTALVALGAEALGIMSQLNAKTLEYTKTRKQFGVPIGSFQALQHRMVDTFMACEQVRSLLYRAVCALEAGDSEARLNLHALKVMVDRAGKQIYGEAIQLHGGMGITDELDIGHYAKRLMMIIATFGNGDWHQAQFNRLRYASRDGDNRS